MHPFFQQPPKKSSPLSDPQLRAVTDKVMAEQAVKTAKLHAERLKQLVPAVPKKKKVVLTKAGTPCSPKWNSDWIALVEETESELGRRCCGAHAPDERPCQLESNSKNGRCRFHGGGLGIGAPKGNSNARIHGLYSRRLQQCGIQCPHWKSCPYAGEDVKALAENKRPNCFYETEELTYLRKLDDSAHEVHVPIEARPLQELNQKPYPMHAQLLMLRENLNMLQVMIIRAARALSAQGFTAETIQQSDTWYAAHQKPSAHLQAHQILTREHRLTLGLYNRLIKDWGLPKYATP